MIPLIIGSLGGGVRRIQKNIESILAEKTAAVKIVQEMQKMVLMEFPQLACKLKILDILIKILID